MEFLKDIGRGMFGLNSQDTFGKKIGSGLRETAKFYKANPITTTGVLVGSYFLPERLEKLDQDIADYEQFWIDKQGHANAPRLEDYQNNASYIENGITYTKDDYDPMEEYTKDYKLYWDMRPLDMEYR
jgi:hypothetical protein